MIKVTYEKWDGDQLAEQGTEYFGSGSDYDEWLWFWNSSYYIKILNEEESD